MSNLVNLHIHSEGSFLDGYSRVDDIARRAKELGQPAVALTDHGEVNMHLEFQKACKRHEIFPVFGMEGYYTFDIEASRQAKTKGLDNSHITLLAKNQRGLSNLWAWSSKAYESKYFYLKPQADLALMREHAEGLYASDGCMLTEFGRSVEKGDESRCREIYATLLSVFGESFYVELHPWQFCNPQSPEEQNLNAQMTRLNHAKIRLAQELGIPMVVVNDAHYAWPKDWENHALVWEFNTKGNSDQTARGQTAAWMMSDDEMVHWMAQHGVSRSITEEAIKNSFLIAENCTAEIVPTLEMPRLTASERDDVEMFIDLVEQGFKDKVVRAGLPEDVYGPRMISEIDVIAERDFCGYFNIVSDYVKACKTGKYIQYVQPGSDPDPLIIGPGRGSAGGSLVAYLMDITTVDPIKYDLSFNRFISPGRKGLPDIDVDVPQSKRLDIKQYFAYRYGQDHVCGIGTRSRSQPRAMLADLCRVMGIPFMDRKKMSDILDEVSDIEEDETASWDEVLSEKGGDLAPWANKYPDLFRKMGEMVGLARQSGTHAAGILVSSKPIQGNLPTRVKNDQVVSQLDMHEVEELGAVKLDVLGLRHLDTLSVARNLIHERHGILLDYYSFGDKEFSDPAIWEQIDKGQTTGIFQLETASGTKVATEFKPRNEIDVAVLSAVNRPGVIRAGLLNHYLWRRSGTEEISFDHPLMEELVGDTCGILVYQEQLTRAAEVLAGFTPQEADDLRKLIGKKEIDRLGPMKVKFIEGCLGNDAFTSVMANQQSAVKAAEKIWMSFEASGSYAFNKSHAIEYGTISSWEIWTKHYYPKEFLTALMQTDSGNINRYVREARRKGIPILPPDINLSGRKFTLVDNEIRYGLDSVFAVGNSATTDILEKRPFGSLDDFLNRTDGRGANRKQVIINLIMIGAFDRFGDRATLLKSYYETRKDCGDLTIPDFSDEDVLYKIEQELVGNYVTIDPMEKYVRALEAVALRHPSDVNDVSIMDRLVIGGQITKIKPHKTKRGRDMAFLVVSWNEEDFDVTVFPEEWSSCQNLLKVGAPVACQCIRLERGCCLQALERLDLMEWT